MFYAFLVISLFGSALAEMPGIGPCPYVNVEKNFNISEFLGTWYEAERYFQINQIGATCVTNVLTASDNETMSVRYEQISGLTGSPSSMDGTARVIDPSEPAKLRIKFSTASTDSEGNYWILGTDYDSFALVYSCTSSIILNVQSAWILTRDRNPSADVISKADQVIADNNINRLLFIKTKQTGCNLP